MAPSASESVFCVESHVEASEENEPRLLIFLPVVVSKPATSSLVADAGPTTNVRQSMESQESAFVAPEHAPHVEAKSAGTVRFTPTMRYVTNAKGDKVVISRSGEVIIADDNNRERERHKVPYGATLQVSDGDQLRAGKQVANWDPHHRLIITEYAGTIKFEHVE